MQFTLKHMSPGWIRIRLAKTKISIPESRDLRLALLSIPGVEDVRIFRSTGGAGIRFLGESSEMLRALRDLDTFAAGSKSYPDTQPESPFLDQTEIKRRGLAPHVKRKMRMQILTEAAFDALMPGPVQMAYHAWQLVRLEKM